MFELLDLDSPLDESQLIPIVQLEEGQIDPRYLRTSYSSSLDFHACPRKFQLLKLQAERKEDLRAQITFAYGHAIGEGIQNYLIHRDLNKAIMAAFLAWEVDYDAVDEKRNKSMPKAVAALMEFEGLCKLGMLDDYEVAYFKGKPAAELSFRIKFEYTTYRGFVDLVLRNKFTGEYLILELKTSSANYINHLQYKNSAQALGYSVILDKIAPGTSSYSVLYLVELTKLGRFEPFEFPKTAHQRALWIKDRLWDEQVLVGMVQTFGNYGIWPTHGESCTQFGSVCPFMDMCHLTTEHQMTPLRENHLTEDTEYDFEFTVSELLEQSESACSGEPQESAFEHL